MATLTLTDPTNNTTADATVISSNNTAIKALVNGGLQNDNIASNASISYSKLALTGAVVNADLAGSIAASKLSGYPADATKALVGDGTWVAQGQKLAYVGYPWKHGNTDDNTWETANAAILTPFTVQVAQTIDRIHFLKGVTNSGNFDIGVYNAAGTKMVSKGATAQSTLTVSTLNEVTFGSTALPAGAYYLAIVADNTAGTFASYGAGTGGEWQRLYQLKVAAAYPLPASLTPGSTKPTNGLSISAPLT